MRGGLGGVIFSLTSLFPLGRICIMKKHIAWLGAIFSKKETISNYSEGDWKNVLRNQKELSSLWAEQLPSWAEESCCEIFKQGAIPPSTSSPGTPVRCLEAQRLLAILSGDDSIKIETEDINEPLSRWLCAKLIIEVFKLNIDVEGAPHFDDVLENDHFYSFVETAYNYDLMRGYADGIFAPQNKVTFAEFYRMLYDAQLVIC